MNSNPEKINRPMNCFMIYKRDKKHAILASNPMINFRDISKIVADQWRAESQEVKEHYKNLAKIEMKNHQEKYPDYRFPSSKGKHGKKKAKGVTDSTSSDKKIVKSVGRPKKEIRDLTDEKNEKLQEYIARLKNISGITFQDSSQIKKNEEGFTIPDGSDAIYKHRVLPPLIQNRGFIPKGESYTGYLLPRPQPSIGPLDFISRSMPTTVPTASSVLPVSSTIGSIPSVTSTFEEYQNSPVLVKNEDGAKNKDDLPIQRVATPSTPLINSYGTPISQKSLIATPESSPLNLMEQSSLQFKPFRPMAISEISETSPSNDMIQDDSLYIKNEDLEQNDINNQLENPSNLVKRGRPRGSYSPGQYTFQCELCSSTFVRRHDLKRHLLLHSGLGPYRCSCGRHFSRQDFFSRHVQSCRSKMILSPPESPALSVDESSAPDQLL